MGVLLKLDIINTMRKWIPIEDIPLQMDLHDLHDSVERLQIKIISGNDGRVLLIDFERYFAYQNADELCTLEKLELNPILSTSWPLFLTNESDYLNGIVSGSYGIISNEGLTHYVITCGNNIIEVVTNQEPHVSWIQEEVVS